MHFPEDKRCAVVGRQHCCESGYWLASSGFRSRIFHAEAKVRSNKVEILQKNRLSVLEAVLIACAEMTAIPVPRTTDMPMC